MSAHQLAHKQPRFLMLLSKLLFSQCLPNASYKALNYERELVTLHSHAFMLGA